MRIGILVFPGVQLLDVAGPADVFVEAARQLGDLKAYQVQVIGTEAGALRCGSGPRLQVDATIANHRARLDTLLVAGGPEVATIVARDDLQRWLRRQAKAVRRIGSVCSGAFVLAAAGLLQGRRVATHWNSVDRLAAENPGTRVEPDAIYVKDGPLYTSAGVTAGMDLALALVEEDHGRDLALRVARELVMFLKRPGGQSQFSAHLAAQTAEKSAIRTLQDHVLANLRGDLSVPALALRAGMSERNFARVFKDEVGLTPAEFVEIARIDEARRRLEASDLPLKRLADAVGYANADALRRAFARRVGVGLRDYRRRFT
ncbi:MULTISPECIES: GlxA family transcriptional regulator [unclassified Rhizobacter]|uniref:GlxA family transcriptional regulator n=1 Tax=unclassified Rhizobacter TaxID=2640088 RepID=UPI000701371F|nr:MULTISPECIES: DJ-1/PfpI family protein [unclassified Rhizobacter]KQU78001.1 AraC family transcriptional regulator [Rhizobacter sp. Root29]KQW15747.1 AraC family transcriptional regulator [Rhizobacter sp. Root1238]KRB24859.1 AraC family transcriptional regulator [Rhizobacter sp. Root16D2]